MSDQVWLRYLWFDFFKLFILLRKWLQHFLLVRISGEIIRIKHFKSDKRWYHTHFWSMVLFKSGITIFAWRTTYSLFNPVLLAECSCSSRKYWFLMKMISAQQIDHFYSWICSWTLLYALHTHWSCGIFQWNQIWSIWLFF